MAIPHKMFCYMYLIPFIAIDGGHYVGAVFLDLAKVFDCVDHGILLHKLSYYGINGNNLSWLTSFFESKNSTGSLSGVIVI